MKKWWAGFWAVVLVLSLVGCSSGKSNDAATPSSSTGSANSGSGDNSAGSKTLTVAWQAVASTLDPVNATSDILAVNAYDRLIGYEVSPGDGDAAKAFGLKPMLAKSWTISEDGLTYTFQLQDNASFQSGNPVTANSVKFSLERMRDSATGGFTYGLTQIESITVQDDKTIVLKLKKANPKLLQMLAMYWFSILDDKLVQEKGDAYVNDHAVGSGPYIIEKWDPSSEVIFKANKNYWAGAPKIDQITMKYIKEASNRLMLLKNGDIDVSIELPPKDLKDLKSATNLTVHSNSSNRILFLAMNMNKEPFTNPKVRQALSYAVPYDQLIEDVMFNEARPMRSSVPSNTPGSTDEGYEYRYDLDKAKQLLTEAGFPNGFNFDLTVGSGYPDWDDDAILLQASFAKIGVNMNIKNVARPQFLEMQKQRTMDAYISRWTSMVYDPSWHLGLLMDSKGTGNYHGYNNPTVDQLLQQANDERDETKRMALYHQAQKIITADAPWLYLYQYNRIVGVSNNVTGYKFYPDEFIRFADLDKA
ncbi:ABC transporter substrate-binding protein [Paenibacillus beijingensis]|uniref:Peptide ABC transporter substrate-binding protein n=1 Tax=Paenibacillus beijingensis TaxID=1126833 RepID=A0A0D5NHC5_9BACL|nr:ABC transporter substrate-binding protein [Paenibacillus beijingensis]AJY74784.1 peptide ABC transporter substrate-binding protein [Paenibacillus beijingensis]